MSKRITVHVAPRRDGWAVRKEDNIRDTSSHRTQREAIDAGRELARSKAGKLIIHRKDGRVRNRYRYNSDPLPPKSVPEVLFHPSVTEKAKRAIIAAVEIAMKKSGRRASPHVLPHLKAGVRGEGKSPIDTHKK